MPSFEPVEPSPSDKALPLRKVLILLAVQACVMAGLGMALWRWSGRSLARFIEPSPSGAAMGVLLGLALIALAWSLFRGLPTIGEALVRMQAKTYGFMGGRLPFGAIVFIALCAGVGEEALFRGGLQTYLAGHVGVPAAIALSSAAFAAIHLGRPVVTALLFGIGALFGTIYWQTGSLLAVMIGHALYDVWALRYLLSEFVRLGLLGEPPLANPADAG